MQQFLWKFAVYFINNFYNRVQDAAGRCRPGPVDAGRAWVIKCRFPADRAQPATRVCRLFFLSLYVSSDWVESQVRGHFGSWLFLA